ncbi:MAG: ABC transporter ATP-binding protein [Fidelibacterota bacterium]
MASVTLKNINKSFQKGQSIIENFSLEVNDGEFLVLVGPSGCGKSTLLRIIAGLETPTTGEVFIAEKQVNKVPPKDRDIAMVFQNYALYPHLNVYDNLAFGLKLRKVPKVEIAQRVSSVADILGIQNLLQRKPKQLSGGQRQRVALGRAIIRDPQVFLFDEPLSNLDSKLRVQMRAEIKRLHQRLGNTMIYVTHDQVEAMTMGDRIVVINEGHIQQVGIPMKVYRNPDNIFVAGFIGSPPMNLLKGIIENGIFKTDGLSIDLGRKTGIREFEGQSVVIGIRPGTIRVVTGGNALPLIVAEPLGNETILHLKVGENVLTAKVRGLDIDDLKDKIEIGFNVKKLCLFDSVSQKRIY